MTPDSDAASLDAWLAELADVPPWRELLAPDAGERARLGYGDTLREMCGQPLLWGNTAERTLARADEVLPFIRRGGRTSIRPIVLTGSGSSEYAGACIAPVLQARLDTAARAVSAGLLLTHADAYVTRADPPLIVSLARSGDSPESTAALELLLDAYPRCPHLAITCNAQGRLATAYSNDPRVLTLVLDPRTNDRSLVMTSSFTNLVVAGGAVGALDNGGDAYRRAVARLSLLAREILRRHAAALADLAASTPFDGACYLGAGAQLGAARESALKMLEMSGGTVATLAETPLGLRHGPMAALRRRTIVVAGLPPAPAARSYVLDVLHEIRAKDIAASQVVIGDDIPPGLLHDRDVAVSVAGYSDLEFGLQAVLDVLVGQILAFFRCRAAGLRPDAPSPGGVISRVVPPFRIHR